MPSDVIIVLGGGINPDGTLRGPSKCRVEKAFELFKLGVAPLLLTSSKYSMNIEFIPPKTIAESMKDKLIVLGIPSNRIYIEEESQDTLGNIYFTKKNFLIPKNWKKIVVVTSPFQAERAEYLFKKFLGSDFQVEIVLARNGLNEEELAKQEILEKKQLEAHKSDLSKINNGDDNELQRWIDENHPVYGRHSKYTKDEYHKHVLGNAGIRSPFHEDNTHNETPNMIRCKL